MTNYRRIRPEVIPHRKRKPNSAAFVLRSVCQRFLTGPAGQVSVENAIILTVIVAVAIISFDAFSRTVKGSFSPLSHVGENQSLASAKGTTGDRLERYKGAIDDAGHPTATWRTYDVSRLVISFAALIVGLILCGWLLLRRRKTETGPEQDKQLPVELCDVLFKKRQQILRILSGDDEMLLKSRVTVGYLMSRRVRSVSPRTPAKEVSQTMAEQRFRHMMVVDKENRLLGVISDRDVSSRNGATAGDIMTKNPATVSPDTPIGPAITMLVSRNISCLPVVEGDTVCGVLTTTDLMLTLQCCLRLVQDLAGQLYDSPGESNESPIGGRDVVEPEEFRYEEPADAAR